MKDIISRSEHKPKWNFNKIEEDIFFWCCLFKDKSQRMTLIIFLSFFKDHRDRGEILKVNFCLLTDKQLIISPTIWKKQIKTNKEREIISIIQYNLVHNLARSGEINIYGKGLDYNNLNEAREERSRDLLKRRH